MTFPLMIKLDICGWVKIFGSLFAEKQQNLFSDFFVFPHDEQCKVFIHCQLFSLERGREAPILLKHSDTFPCYSISTALNYIIW